MLTLIKNLIGKEVLTAEDFRVGMARRNLRHPNRPFFPQGKCPFSDHVRKKGVLTRQFASTRHDN